MNDEVSLRGISKLYRQGKDQQSQKNIYIVDRVIDSEQVEGSYLTDLPTIEGNNVLEILDLLPGGKVLDIGCGQGNFLIALSKEFGNKFTYDGITTYPYHDAEKIKEANIHIEIADIQKLHRRNEYNVIVAEHSLQYTQNPLIALKRIYDSLVEGGIALIHPFQVRFSTPEEHSMFIEYMEKEYGFIFSRGRLGSKRETVAFRKTKNRLTFPVAISKIVEVGNEFISSKQMEYCFKSEQI